jgi:2-methylcitrate dehydratase PrpD
MSPEPPQEVDEAMRTVAQWAAGLEYSDIPASVVEKAKDAILDVVGVTLGGAATSIAHLARRRAFRDFRSGRSSVAGERSRLVPAGAAFSNSVAAHALDFDDTTYAGMAHTSSVVLPAALAVVQDLGLSGQALLTAFVAGTETEIRLGLLCTNDVYYRGWWTTGVLGVFGAAVASARTHALDGDGVMGALSLAAGRAAGLRRCLGSPAKPLYAGFASQSGVEAAQLIAMEALEMTDMFGGETGFLKVIGGDNLDTQALTGLGNSYALNRPGLAQKAYPVCSAAQAALQATHELLTTTRIDPRDVTRVACYVPPLVEQSLRFNKPSTVCEAQFSMQFAIGCLLRFGRLTPDLLCDEVLMDQDVAAAMERVVMVPERANPGLEELESATVVLTTKEGQELRRTVAAAKGTVDNPMSEAELQNKFQACSSTLLQPDAVARCIERIRSLENLRSCNLLLGSE